MFCCVFISEDTRRHLFTRVNEHLTSDKSSHIYKHLSESLNCRLLNSLNSFKILDQSSTEYELRIKEALYIQLNKPSLNKQVKHVNLIYFLCNFFIVLML